jgi:putative transposase
METLQWTLDHCRELYNAALQERRDTWNIIKQHPNYYDDEWRKQAAKEHAVNYYTQARQLTDIKEIREEYKGLHSQVLQEVLKRVGKTFDAFFQRVKAGKPPGYPRFQGKNRYDSFTYPQSGFSLTHDTRLCLSKVGTIKVKIHCEIVGTVKTCTIKKEGEHWYVTFACEGEQVKRLPYTDDAVGIDLGVTKLATLSTGDVIENPKHYRKPEKKLEKAQQALSRKKRGSKRRKKAVQRVAAIHRKIRNQRNDYLQKWSRWLVDTYETIVFEDIKPAHLSKALKPKQDEEGKYLPNGAAAKGGLNKSILDAGWSTFITLCECKAASAGTVQVIRVDPKYTRQVCSGCGSIRKKTLDERWHSCECGCELDRDHNASINILRLGRSHQTAQVA